MRICALLNIGVLATLLAWTASETWRPDVAANGVWMLFLLSAMFPFCVLLWLLETRRFGWGVPLAKVLGLCWCFPFLSTFGLPSCTLGIRLMPQYYCWLLWTFACVPLEAIMVRGANLALAARPLNLVWRQAGLFLAMITYSAHASSSYGGHLPRYLPVSVGGMATQTLWDLHTAEAAYFETHGSRYSPNLRPICSNPGPENPNLCGSDWRGAPHTFVKDGYFFSYVTAETGGYEIHADPIARGSTGQRSFFVDQSGEVRSNRVNRASSVDKPI